MNWHTLDFGKHTGKSLPQVLFDDPDWFFWAMETGVFRQNLILLPQAMDLAEKATKIGVPQSGPEKLVVKHYLHIPTRKYSHFDVVPENQPAQQEFSITLRADFIDLSLPRRFAKYDKKGGKNIVASLKLLYFGSKSAKMSRDRCEAFFNTPENFDC